MNITVNAADRRRGMTMRELQDAINAGNPSGDARIKVASTWSGHLRSIEFIEPDPADAT